MEQAIERSEASPALAHLAKQARDYVSQAKAENTLRAYRTDWRDFTDWCQTHGRMALPADPETLALYLTAKAEACKVATLQRRLVAIGQAHETAGHASPAKHPAVKAVWAGIRRTKGVAPNGKAPVVTAELRRMVETLNDAVREKRDRALLLLGFAGAFRRSELVSLNREDLEITLGGVTVHLRRSKTDQDGQGRKVGIPYGSRSNTCPVRAVQAWLEASGIRDGALFRNANRHGQLGTRLTAQSVALVVKRCAEAAGLDPAQFSGHSLRAGLATAAAAAGVSERAIMQQTGHRSVLVVRRYIRDGSLYRDNAAAAVGL